MKEIRTVRPVPENDSPCIHTTHGRSQWSNAKMACSPVEAAYRAGVGRTTIFAEMKAGRLPRRKVGRRTIILLDDLNRWLKSLPEQTENTPTHEEDR